MFDVGCVCFRTLGVPVIRSFLRQSVQVILEQKLVAGDPLNRFQHVVLQGQVPTALLPLHAHNQPTSAHDALHQKQNQNQNSYLDLLDDGLELSRSLRPDVHQLHGSVKVLHILSIHLQEGSQLLEDVSDPWVGVPAGRT